MRTQSLYNFIKKFQDAVAGFIQNNRVVEVFMSFEKATACRFLGSKEPSKEESVAGSPESESAVAAAVALGALVTGRPRLRHSRTRRNPGVADCRCARITNEHNILPFGKTIGYHLR